MLKVQGNKCLLCNPLLKNPLGFQNKKNVNIELCLLWGTFQELPVDAWNATCSHFDFSAKSKRQWLQSQGGREGCMSGLEWRECRAAQPKQLSWLKSQPHYALRWLNIRKTRTSLTFEAKKLCWSMSHFSFVLLFFICREWPLFSCCCFVTTATTKKMNAHCANITFISLA